jgi:hypothetical protein
MKNVKTKATADIREQMEEVMGNRVNVVNGRSEIGTSRRQRRGEAASKGKKQAVCKQQASKKSE